MPKYLLTYKGTGEPMPEPTPEQGEAIMQAWMTWGEKAGEAIVDFGAPLTPVGDADVTLGGYSILEVGDLNTLRVLLEGHPHTLSGGTIEIHEFQPVPGM